MINMLQMKVYVQFKTLSNRMRIRKSAFKNQELRKSVSEFEKVHSKTKNQKSPILMLEEIIGKLLN